MLPMKAAGAEAIGRLSNIDQAAEELLSSRPQAVVEIALKCKERTDFIETLKQNNENTIGQKL